MGGGFPDVDFYILQAWGFPDEVEGWGASGFSGLVFGTNPPYLVSDFLAMYPKFGPSPGVFVVPQLIIQLYINLANASLIQNNWGISLWPVAMGLFVAHFCTLYLQSDGTPSTIPGVIAQSGMARGIAISKSAGDVSVGYQTLLSELSGFAQWTLTTYGTQLATFGKTIGTRSMLLW